MENLSYLAFSKRMAGYLAERTGASEEKEAVLAYIIEVLVLNTAGVLLAGLLGFVLGVFYGTAICLLVVALFRQTAGGAHSQSALRCGAITMTVFPLLAISGKLWTLLPYEFTTFLSIAAIIVSFIVIGRLAPVDTPQAPIISPARRKRLKVMSLLLLVGVLTVTVFLSHSDLPTAAEIQNYLSVSILWVSLVLSKPGHRLMELVDSI